MIDAMSAQYRYKIILSYDGTRYAGWQIQPRSKTIQGEIEQAILTLSGERVRVHASGRTDRGVHAKAQVAHFDLKKKVPIQQFKGGLNALLEFDIRITLLSTISPDFHARFDAKTKEYRYQIWNDETVPPFVKRYRNHVRKHLDAEAMNQAAKLLMGKKDFASFSANPNCEVDGTVRHLSKLAVKKHGCEIVISAVGNGFLYKMVRSLAGFLICVGMGEQFSQDAKDLLRSKTRTAQVPTAPPEGLFLWKVGY
ncbi:MAG: tRNA pseudouridine(38-40) synthase TruA [Kiritimatiellae bacterium]|nr:tRNA pseudouridine(38-40) synthase TruA [Kiritimatiellia bacterium]